MKIYELNENEPLEIIEVTNPVFIQIQMKIFTDGEIMKESEETTKKIKEYYIGNNKYPYDVKTLKTKNIFFQKHSYVITYLLARERINVGNIRGCFYIVKDISIYLKDKNDKKALKTAKYMIKQIENYNKNVDYSSVLKILFSHGKELKRIKTEQLSKNVYTLRKIKYK